MQGQDVTQDSGISGMMFILRFGKQACIFGCYGLSVDPSARLCYVGPLTLAGG